MVERTISHGDILETPHRVVLFGVPIDNLSMPETIDRVERIILSGRTHQHLAVNVNKVVKLSRDRELREAAGNCDLISADGQPIVWVSKFLGNPLKERVSGIDLFTA